MKNIFIAIAFILATNQLTFAQLENKFRLGADLGFAKPSNGEGFLLGIEGKQNIADYMNIGVRVENALFIKEVTVSGENLKTDINSSLSFLGTFDYYFNKNGSSFSPFLGIGAGYTYLADIRFEFLGEDTPPDAEVNGKISSLIRTGFEWGKFRAAVNYNLIGKTEIDGAEIKNSYLGISLGFYVGGGKWKKQNWLFSSIPTTTKRAANCRPFYL